MIAIEKFLILKSIDLFKQTDDEILMELALASVEKNIMPEEKIITKGEIGSSLFVVVNGKVKVHDGKNKIAELCKSGVFGELAALSPEVRIASVTAIDESLVLEIQRDVIYDLMNLNVGLAQGIIEVLCKRVRELAIISNDRN